MARNLVKKRIRKDRVVVLGIDPGLRGSLVATDGEEYISIFAMPLIHGKREIHFQALKERIADLAAGADVVCLERAIPFAMGAKGAFSYGMGYERTLRAIDVFGPIDLLIVEPSKWTKEMHGGISDRLKPKAKSLVAVKRLFPRLWKKLPKDKKGRLLDGPVDALLIAGYGLRQLGRGPELAEEKDFY